MRGGTERGDREHERAEHEQGSEHRFPESRETFGPAAPAALDRPDEG